MVVLPLYHSVIIIFVGVYLSISIASLSPLHLYFHCVAMGTILVALISLWTLTPVL